MDSLAIGSFDVMSGGEPANGILLQSIKGLESPNQRLNSFSKPGADGAVVSGQHYDARLVEFAGKIVGDTFAEYESNRRGLIGAVAISRDDNDYPIPIRVYFTTVGGLDYYADCYFDKPLLGDGDSPIECDFLITAVSADPFIYGQVEISSSAISPPSGGGYAVPMIVPYISAASTGGSTILPNTGSEKAWPVIVMTGPLTTPVATNVTTGKLLQLNYTIGAGDEVIIDMKNRTITLNGASLISTKTSTSDWWALVPGDNTITLTTTSSSDTGSMTVAFNPPFIGV